MIKELIKLANHLDQKGLTKEADIVDNILKSAQVEGARALEDGRRYVFSTQKEGNGRVGEVIENKVLNDYFNKKADDILKVLRSAGLDAESFGFDYEHPLQTAAFTYNKDNDSFDIEGRFGMDYETSHSGLERAEAERINIENADKRDKALQSKIGELYDEVEFDSFFLRGSVKFVKKNVEFKKLTDAIKSII